MQRLLLFLVIIPFFSFSKEIKYYVGQEHILYPYEYITYSKLRTECYAWCELYQHLGELELDILEEAQGNLTFRIEIPMSLKPLHPKSSIIVNSDRCLPPRNPFGNRFIGNRFICGSINGGVPEGRLQFKCFYGSEIKFQKRVNIEANRPVYIKGLIPNGIQCQKVKIEMKHLTTTPTFNYPLTFSLDESF